MLQQRMNLRYLLEEDARKRAHLRRVNEHQNENKVAKSSIIKSISRAFHKAVKTITSKLKFKKKAKHSRMPSLSHHQGILHPVETPIDGGMRSIKPCEVLVPYSPLTAPLKELNYDMPSTIHMVLCQFSCLGSPNLFFLYNFKPIILRQDAFYQGFLTEAIFGRFFFEFHLFIRVSFYQEPSGCIRTNLDIRYTFRFEHCARMDLCSNPYLDRLAYDEDSAERLIAVC